MNDANMLVADCAGETAVTIGDESAWKIEAALEAAGFSARTWVGGANVRVYVKSDKGKDCGFVALKGGVVDRSGLTRQAGTIAAIAESAVQS